MSSSSSSSNNNNTIRRRQPQSRRRATIICGGENISDILGITQGFTQSQRTNIVPGSLKRPRDFNEGNVIISSKQINTSNTVIKTFANESGGSNPLPTKMTKEDIMFEKEEEELRLSIYKEMEESLKQKVKALRDEGVRLKKIDKNEAMKAFAKAKELIEQMKLLVAAQNHPSKPYPPEYRRVKRFVEQIVKFPEVPVDRLQVTVNSVEGLSLQGSSVLNTYVYSEFRFSDGLPQTILRSSTVSGSSSPTYNYTAYIPIERKKCYAKFFERKKIVFSVYQKRPFFLPDVLLAKFEVPLVGLINKAENDIIAPLILQNIKRSEQDGNAYVNIKLQVPLIGDDVRLVEVEDIEIVGEIFNPNKIINNNVNCNNYDNTNKQLNSSENEMNIENKNEAKEEEEEEEEEKEEEEKEEEINEINSQIKTENIEDMPTETESDAKNEDKKNENFLPPQNNVTSLPNVSDESKDISVKEVEQNDNPFAVDTNNDDKDSSITMNEDGSQNVDIEALKKEARNVKRYNSAELSDMEISRIDNEIRRYKTMGKNVPEELSIRRSLIENQSTVLTILVQNGKLTMEQYVKQLNDMVAADEALLEKLCKIPVLKVEMNMTKSRIKILREEIQSGQE